MTMFNAGNGGWDDFNGGWEQQQRQQLEVAEYGGGWEEQYDPWADPDQHQQQQ